MYKRLCYLLLFAMVCASVPVHQLFHKHKAGKIVAAGVQLNKFEKPCCKVFEGVSGDTPIQQPQLKNQPLFSALVIARFDGYVSGPFLYINNKAPPVTVV